MSTLSTVLRAPGRRTLTPAMMQAREELKRPSPATPSRAEILGVLRNGFQCLGLSRGAANLLETMVRHTPSQDWDAGGSPFIFARNTTLLRWIGRNDTTLRRYIRELADRAYLVPMDGRNGHRGRRYDHGANRAGFDLTSLRYRFPELKAQLNALKAYEYRCQALRDEMTALYQEIGYYGASHVTDSDKKSLRLLMRKRLRLKAIEPLQHLKTMMQDVHAHYLKKAKNPPVDKGFSAEPNPPEMAPMTAKNDTPYTTTKKDKNSYEVEPVALNERNCIDHAACETSVSSRQTAQNGETVSSLTDVLGGFRGTSQFFLDVCPTLRDLCTTARPKLADLMEAAEHLTQHLGISLHSWQQGCVILGREKTAIAVIIMAARISRGADIRNREAYLRAMIERGRLGMLRLDRSLFGLRGDPDHAITPASAIRAKFRAILAEHTAACA